MPGRAFVIAFIAGTFFLATGCGGDDGDNDVNPPVATATAAASAATSAVSGPTATEEPQAQATPRPTLPPGTPGAPFDETRAAALLDSVLLKPVDITEAGWIVQSDNTVDNATAAQTNPDQAASNERCGRLLSRTITNFPPDVITAFIGGTTLSFFSTSTVYADEAGAADCSAEAADRLARPGELARTFGGVFVDPAAVVVTPVEFPTVGDGSFAATLTGKSNANGTEIDLTILVVGFTSGHVSAAVGSARSGSTPSTDELAPYVELVAQRIEESQ